MSWTFLPTGLLMPAAVPMDKADPEFTEGKFDFQIRARAVSHLEDFIKFYMEPGTYSKIQHNPNMDYNCRFYTTREAYADGIRKQIMETDYEKFKPTAEFLNADGSMRKDGKVYHEVLNSIWGTVTRLGAPGGKWAKRDSAYKYSSWSGNYAGTGKTVGSTFFEEESQADDWDDWDNRKPVDHVAELLAELGDIPEDQWYEYVSPSEWELLVRFGYAEPVDFSEGFTDSFTPAEDLPDGFSFVADDDPMWNDDDLTQPLPEDFDNQSDKIVDRLIADFEEPKVDFGTPDSLSTKKFNVPDLTVTVNRVKASRQTRRELRAEKRRQQEVPF